MKYKLLQNLPFMKAGSVFGTGCWASGGYGVDLGTTKYQGGGSSHNGTKTFNQHQNALLKDILDDEKWVEWMPESVADYLLLYDSERLSAHDLAMALRVKALETT